MFRFGTVEISERIATRFTPGRLTVVAKMYEFDDPAFYDHSGRWFSRGDHAELEPHEAAALFMWEYRPIPAALAPVVREMLDGTGELSRKPPESRQRAPRRLAPHEEYAFKMYRTKQFSQSEIAEMVRREHRMPCTQGQISKWCKKAHAWDTGEAYKPYRKYPNRTVSRSPKAMERTVEDQSGDDDNPASCGGGIRVLKKPLRDQNDRYGD